MGKKSHGRVAPGIFGLVSGPPSHVLTGLMQGGPLDGCMVEIDAGAETLEFSEWPVMLAAGDSRLPELPTYRYAGEVDAQGHAVYRLAE